MSLLDKNYVRKLTGQLYKSEGLFILVYILYWLHTTLI